MLFAFVAFIGLLIVGRIKDELRRSHIALCLLIAVASAAAFALFGGNPSFYIAVLALMDIVLVLAIFKGDIQIR